MTRDSVQRVQAADGLAAFDEVAAGLQCGGLADMIRMKRAQSMASHNVAQVVQAWLQTDMTEASLALTMTDAFLEVGDDDEQQAMAFAERMNELGKAFEKAETQVANVLGAPSLTAAPCDGKLPPWAQSGYRLSSWNVGERMIYLHVTHRNTELPLELTLGVVTGPPTGWVIGS